MSAAAYQGIDIFVEPLVPPDSIDLYSKKGDGFRFSLTTLDNTPHTPDEITAHEVANRLLNRGGPALTLDMMQRALDSASGWSAPITRITMPPAVYREYVKLVSEDSRYTSGT